MNDSTTSPEPAEGGSGGSSGGGSDGSSGGGSHEGSHGEPRAETPYAAIARSTEFQQLRHRYRGFAFPATVAFMVWYLLFVIAANWLPGFMSVRIAGNVNIALVFGLLQFASTFLIAWLYARHANRKLDPIAQELNDRYKKEVGE